MITNTTSEITIDTMPLWEILVPTVRNDGRPFRLRYHRVWDERVKEVANGITILTPVIGAWLSDDGEEFRDRTIPVRVRCSREDIISIAEMTKVYYEQLAVMVYRISDDCMVI